MGQPLRTPTRPSFDSECRCLCGSLLARLVEGGVELKCRRCKRTQVIPLGKPPEARGGRPLPATP